VGVTAGRERKKGGSRSRSLLCLDFLTAARGADAPPLSCSSRCLPGTVLDCFGGYFINFKLVNVIFMYF